MKMNSSIVLVCSMLVASTVLQGCFNLGEEEKKLVKDAEKDAEAIEEGTASCKDGKFSCDGNWKSWCAEQARRCSAKNQGSCTPTCTYKCGKTKCNQVCAPKCGQALCSTRCKKFNTNSCKMVCGKPECKVVCPDHFCPNKDCLSCRTECGNPACKMECDKPGDQPCHNVCAKPKCDWECKAPSTCPPPKCVMKCQKPKNCLADMVAGELPGLEPGETEVLGFHLPADQAARFAGGAPGPAPAASPAPAAFLQLNTTASTVRVDIATMGKDRSLQQAQVQVQLAPVDTARALTSWTRTVRKQGGKVMESEASCENGLFQCQGDEAWCSQQREAVCSEAAEVSAAGPQESEEVVQVAEDSNGAQSQKSIEAAEPAADAQAEKDGAIADAEKEAEASGESDGEESAFFQKRVGRQQSRLQA